MAHEIKDPVDILRSFFLAQYLLIKGYRVKGYDYRKDRSGYVWPLIEMTLEIN